MCVTGFTFEFDCTPKILHRDPQIPIVLLSLLKAQEALHGPIFNGPLPLTRPILGSSWETALPPTL